MTICNSIIVYYINDARSMMEKEDVSDRDI